MQVRVYRNLHKQTYSVQAKVNGRWKVIEHRPFLFLEDVSFTVQPAGRERVLREKRKNVHAFVQGTLIENTCFAVKGKVSYNPYRASVFTDEKGKARYVASCVYLSRDGMYLAERVA